MSPLSLSVAFAIWIFIWFFFFFQRRLAQKYRIKVGAPALVLVKSGGAEISRPSRDSLDDPAGFPWTPRPLEQVGILMEFFTFKYFTLHCILHWTKNHYFLKVRLKFSSYTCMYCTCFGVSWARFLHSDHIFIICIQEGGRFLNISHLTNERNVLGKGGDMYVLYIHDVFIFFV